jgi:ABC-type multidrug transport system permease subunit
VVGFFYGSVYYQLDTGDGCDENCYTDRMSLMYFSVMLMLMGQLDSISIVIEDRLVYYRERGAKAYSPFAYYLSTFLIQIPTLVLNVLFYSIGMYTLTGLRAGASYYGYFFFLMLFASYCGMFLAYTAASVSRTTEVALSCFPAVFAFNMLYAGYLVYIPAMEEWQKTWLPYLSFFRYAFQGLVLNEFRNNDDLPESHEYIDRLGFDFISVGGCCAILTLFVGIFANFYYLAIRYVDFEER